MKRLILLVALVMAMAVLVPAAFADDDIDADADDTAMTEKGPSAAQERKAKMIAGYFSEGGLAAVESLRSGEEVGHKVGWGVVYKLMLYEGVAGVDKAGVEGGWALGQLRKLYLEDPEHQKKDLHKDKPGQAQKDSKDKPEKPEKATPPGQLKKADKTNS